jgi:dimethylglycine dehydrogenase
VEQRDYYSFKRNEVHDVVGAECRAVRESVGIMDISAFTKVEVSGAGAEGLLNRLVANKLPKNVGGIALTHMLNRAGRIELETTVVKLDEGRYYLVCAAFFEQRLVDHLNHNRDGEEVSVKILSTDWSALAINGPKSRAVMAACTDADLSNAGFPWLKAKEIEVAGVKVWAFRMSYAGELGWELHIPRDGALAVYDALWAAGEAHGIQDYGSFAMNSLRMEKAFKGAGELTNEVTLAEADVLRFARNENDYIGMDKTLNTDDMRWVCAYLEIEPDGVEDGHGGEPIMVDGKVMGSTASVAYGHTVGKILAFAYVRPEVNVAGKEVSVLIAGEPRAARILGDAAYDPTSALPRTDIAAE